MSTDKEPSAYERLVQEYIDAVRTHGVMLLDEKRAIMGSEEKARECMVGEMVPTYRILNRAERRKLKWMT